MITLIIVISALAVLAATLIVVGIISLVIGGSFIAMFADVIVFMLIVTLIVGLIAKLFKKKS